MHITTCARLPHRVACPPPPPFVPSAHLSGRPAPMAGQPAAPQLAISVLAAPPRRTEAKKIAGPPPKISAFSRLRRRASTFSPCIFLAVEGLCGSLSKCKGRREQRGEEDQSAEGGSVAKRIQVQKVAVAPAIPAAPSAAPCTQTPHTKRVGRRWARGGSRAGHMFPRRVCPVLT